MIPETLEVTNISNLKNGDQVNIEVDQNTVAIVDTVKSFYWLKNLASTAILIATPFATWFLITELSD